jgi:hypothetical protein
LIDFGHTHFIRVAEGTRFCLLEEDKLAHPADIRLFCARRTMFELDLISQLIEKFFGRLRHQLIGEFD